MSRYNGYNERLLYFNDFDQYNLNKFGYNSNKFNGYNLNNIISNNNYQKLYVNSPILKKKFGEPTYFTPNIRKNNHYFLDNQSNYNCNINFKTQSPYINSHCSINY